MTYSLDMRQQVLKIRREEGLSMADAAKRFGVGIASVMRWSNNIEAIKKRKRSTKIDMEALKSDVEQYPDAYQFERAARLGVGEHCVWYALKLLNFTYKKNSATPQSGHRSVFCKEIKKHKDQRRSLVFINLS